MRNRVSGVDLEVDREIRQRLVDQDGNEIVEQGPGDVRGKSGNLIEESAALWKKE